MKSRQDPEFVFPLVRILGLVLSSDWRSAGRLVTDWWNVHRHPGSRSNPLIDLGSRPWQKVRCCGAAATIKKREL